MAKKRKGAEEVLTVDLTSSEGNNDDDEGEKYFKKRLKAVTELYLCPISRELMVDPVVAADGST